MPWHKQHLPLLFLLVPPQQQANFPSAASWVIVFCQCFVNLSIACTQFMNILIAQLSAVWRRSSSLWDAFEHGSPVWVSSVHAQDDRESPWEIYCHLLADSDFDRISLNSECQPVQKHERMGPVLQYFILSSRCFLKGRLVKCHWLLLPARYPFSPPTSSAAFPRSRFLFYTFW